MNSNTLASVMAKQIGVTHFRIGSEEWSISELLCLQKLLLLHAPDIRTGMIWWSKSISLFNRRVYAEPQVKSGFFSIPFLTGDQSKLPDWAITLAIDLVSELSSRAHFSHSWYQGPCHTIPLLRGEYSPSFTLFFDLDEINMISSSSSELFQLAKQTLLLLLHQNIEKRDLLSRLRSLIRDEFDQPLRIHDYASRLNVSPRTLQRRLQGRQLSFSSLIEEEKKAAALKLLADTDLSTNRVAEKLGYDDPSNFHRAFRKWFPVSPKKYRELCKENRSLKKASPIRLHYARGSMGQDGTHTTKEGRVWLEVDNISFEKKVSVECIDRDGVWRHYPAFFEGFLNSGTELWSTANLPVAMPLTFRLSYEVDGNKYVDDNLQQDYVVNGRLLIGSPAVIVTNKTVIKESQLFRVVIELVCRNENIGQINCMLNKSNNEFRLSRVGIQDGYTVWTLSTCIEQYPEYCTFTLTSEEGDRLLCANHQHKYQFSPPLGL